VGPSQIGLKNVSRLPPRRYQSSQRYSVGATSLRIIRSGWKKINRKIHHCKNNFDRDALTEERNRIRKGYQNLIKDSKKNAWREFNSPSQPWGKPYKVITKITESIVGIPRIKRQDGILTKDDAEANQAICWRRNSLVTQNSMKKVAGRI